MLSLVIKVRTDCTEMSFDVCEMLPTNKKTEKNN